MIECMVSTAEETTVEVVTKAFARSFTRGQVRRTCAPKDSATSGVVVVLGPGDDDADWLEALARRPIKIVLLGALGPRMARLAGVTVPAVSEDLAVHCVCPPTPAHHTRESSATLVYAPSVLWKGSAPLRRSFCRFDFTDEWNNLGYGRIGVGDGPWSIPGVARGTTAKVIADIVTSDGGSQGAAATLRDLPNASILWFARPVGPVDGPDWAIVESFVGNYRRGELPCRPYLRDIPHGAGAAVTMRLDCDEDIASACPLFDLYRERGLPMSVAVRTGQLAHNANVMFLRDLFAAGGTILSHSVSHSPEWGGSMSAAETEARESKAWLQEHVPGLAVRFAVSPFHQNPTFVPAALAREGYQGFIGGTIACHPEYLMARGGIVPCGPDGFISHSQSCMLHGDCLLGDDDPLRIYKKAFCNAKDTGQFFGYLDHPFSERYTYGWANETERLKAHGDFLDFMMAECARADASLLFVNEETCLDFMLEKSAADILFDSECGTFSVSRTHAAGLPLSIGYEERVVAAAHG
jgi:hypothetical protein